MQVKRVAEGVGAGSLVERAVGGRLAAASARLYASAVNQAGILEVLPKLSPAARPEYPVPFTSASTYPSAHDRPAGHR